jgi:hypothetical protein
MTASGQTVQYRHCLLLAGCSLWPRRRPPMSPHDSLPTFTSGSFLAGKNVLPMGITLSGG